jgi:hypothetical protein
MLPPMYARPLMETGSLAQVLPGVLETDSKVAVVYAERKFVSSQVRAFVDALLAWAPGELPRIPRERHERARRGRRARRAGAHTREGSTQSDDAAVRSRRAEAGPKALKAPGTLGSPGRARLKAAPAPACSSNISASRT